MGSPFLFSYLENCMFVQYILMSQIHMVLNFNLFLTKLCDFLVTCGFIYREQQSRVTSRKSHSFSQKKQFGLEKCGPANRDLRF
jgi:hypothetical protein